MVAVTAEMNSDEAALRLFQQHLVAGFGIFALSAGSPERLVDEASRVAAEGLGTKFAKVLHYRSDSDDFLVIAGVGWHAGVVGTSTLGSGLDSPAGFALHSGQPVLSNHLAQEERFRVPALLAEHGIQSAINVIVGTVDNEPYGVLEVDSTRRHEFVAADISFLQSLANVLAAGLGRVKSEGEKDILIRDKDLLMREVHHRVKNSLQLVRTMLGLQARGASAETKAQLDQAAGRIMSIAAVHQRLYEGGSVHEGDAAVYLQGLLDDMQPLLDEALTQRTVILNAEPVTLSADALTPLGLIVSELVTNAIKYGHGRIYVKVSQVGPLLRIIVEDEGTGFAQEAESRVKLGMRLIIALAKGDATKAVQIDRTVPYGRIVVTVTP